MLDTLNANSDDVQVPKSLIDRVSSRFLTLMVYLATIDRVNDPEAKDLSSDSPLKMVLVTKAGQVIGDILLDNPEGFDDLATQIMDNARNQILSDMEKENQRPANIIGTSAYLIVKNAVLTPWGAPGSAFNYETLYLFADDIIGFSVTSNF